MNRPQKTKKNWRPKLTSIDDPIADDSWSYKTEDGVKRTSRITIGRPALLEDGSHWYCPMYFEHVTPGIDYAFGVGPVDTLMNAMYFAAKRPAATQRRAAKKAASRR